MVKDWSWCKCSLVMLGDCPALGTCSGDIGFVFSTNYYFLSTRKTASSFMTSDLSTPGKRQPPSTVHVTIISGVTNTQQSSTHLTHLALRPEQSWEQGWVWGAHTAQGRITIHSWLNTTFLMSNDSHSCLLFLGCFPLTCVVFWPCGPSGHQISGSPFPL